MAYVQSEQMKKRFALPMVPGLICGEELMRRNYARSQLLDPKHRRATVIEDKLPADAFASHHAALSDSHGGEGHMGNDSATTASLLLSRGGPDASNATAPDAAREVDLTGRVLRFYAFTIESVTESMEETTRVRTVVLHYFLEDNTMSVLEPAEDNSGIEFRLNLKRHRIPQPDGSPIAVSNLRVGEPLTFYGRTYLLYDADVFTREFYTALGHTQPDARPIPADAHHRRRREAQQPRRHDAASSIAATTVWNNMLTPAQVRATQQFLALDRQVLRCDCTWDDSESLYGTTHYLTLNYFLADGSLAIVEKDVPNSGRDAFPMFVRRQRVARVAATTAADGKRAAGTFDSSTLGGVTFHAPTTTAAAMDYYTDADIRIGNVLNIYGRLIKIHDYNEFTRNHLCRTFGVVGETPLPGATPPPYVPPGTTRTLASPVSHDDALQARQRQRRRLAALRREQGTSETVVKFLMRLDHASEHDSIRRFVLTVYLADDTVAIYEPVIRNSGITGGKFLQRQRVLASGEVEQTTSMNVVGDGGATTGGVGASAAAGHAHARGGRHYTAEDFYVGARIRINTFAFVLIASNEHTLHYMETHANAFTHANIMRVVAKFQSMLYSKRSGLAEALRRADETQSTGVELSVLVDVMEQLGLEMSEHELLTVLRYFDRNKEYYVSYEELVARVMPEGAAVSSDERTWQEIYAAQGDASSSHADRETSSLRAPHAHTASLSACDTARFSPIDEVSLEQARREREVAQAAVAAVEFDALYTQRRQLFVKEFSSIRDYGYDGRIGQEEFVRCVRRKLHIHSIDDAKLEALCAVLFAPPYTRVTIEDLLKVFNNTSTLPRNMQQIKNKTAA